MAFIPIYILILFFTIIVDYFAGILIENAHGQQRKTYLFISILSNVGVLALFKYYHFLSDNLAWIGHFLEIEYSGPALTILLPLGLSFHTFQAMSYTIEVYRGNQRAERHPGIFALYVMFYPQLVAGPIERPQHLIHQFYEVHTFDYKRAIDGLKLMAWGMFKKVVIADRLAVFVNQVYSDPTHYQGIPLILSTIFFAFQIYTDFSGYSDIAIGSAKVMGFKLMENFNRPYISQSIPEFWRRWHISLSTWFRDYVYIPLGGNRVKKERWYFNLFITFLISGLWHGANWTYVIWGGIHGSYMLISLWTARFRSAFAHLLGLDRFPKTSQCLRTGITFLLVCFSWIFFRATSLSDAFYVTTHLFSGIGQELANVVSKDILNSQILLGQKASDMILAFVVLGVLGLADFFSRYGSMMEVLDKKPIWVRWAVYYMVLFGVLIFGKFGGEAHQFIYFQF